MSLLLLTPPAEDPFSLAEMKAHLRVAHDDEDNVIAAASRAAARAVESRGEIALVAQGWRLTLDRAPAGVLALPRTPVSAVDAVTIIDADGGTETVSAALYDVEAGAGRLAVRGSWPYSDRALAGVTVDFTAGWADAASVPEELKLAVKLLAAHFYENREAAQAERLFAAPLAVDALIAPYRRVKL